MKNLFRILFLIFLTVLTLTNGYLSILGFIIKDYFGALGYLTATLATLLITVVAYWIVIGFISMEKEDLQPTKETLKYRSKENGKSN